MRIDSIFNTMTRLNIENSPECPICGGKTYLDIGTGKFLYFCTSCAMATEQYDTIEEAYAAVKCLPMETE